MRLFSLCLAILALAVVANVSVSSAAGQSFCAKAMKKAQGKRDAKVGGVTVFHRGQLLHVCSDQLRKSVAMTILDQGQKVAKVKATKSRCMAILITSKTQVPEIFWKDLGAKKPSTSASIIGYGQTAAAVGSLTVTPNCAAAWSESVTSGTTTSYAVKARHIGAGNSLPEGQAVTVATPKAADGIRNVTAKASGKQVIVGWTEAGVKQSKTLP